MLSVAKSNEKEYETKISILASNNSKMKADLDKIYSQYMAEIQNNEFLKKKLQHLKSGRGSRGSSLSESPVKIEERVSESAHF